MSEKVVKFPPETPEQRLIAEIWFLFIMIIVFGLFGMYSSIDVTFTIIITICVIINLILRFLVANQKGDWLFFLLGVAGGGGNDFISMINGVYYYTAIPIIPNLALPLFMWLFWGQVFLLFRKIFNLSWFKGEEFRKDGFLAKGWVDKKIIFDIGLIISLRIVIYNTYLLDFWIPSLCYAIGLSIRFLIFPPKKNEFLIIVILPYAFLFEGLLVLFGLYIYYNPIFLGQPLWLFIWWVFLVPIFLKEIFDRCEFLLKERG
jgi:hypothetical protein